MRIRLLSFASATQILGRPELEIDLPEGSSVRDLKAKLEDEYPALHGLWERLAVAVEGEVVTDDTSLSPDNEVALLPPVSGGTAGESTAGESTAGEEKRTRLTHHPLDVAAVAATVGNPGSGAVALFIGAVRDHHRDRPVLGLEYSAYREMAERRLQRIADELEDSPKIQVAIVHRLGQLAVGEASVVIAVSSPHREAAFDTCRRALERLKAEVPIWKRERYADGEAAWREEESLVR